MLNPFASNPVILQAGNLAEAYGKTPDEIMGMALTPAESFWFNADVWAANRIFEKRVKKQNQNTSASGSSPQEQQHMASEQAQRAAESERMKEAGQHTTPVDEQLERLQNLKAQRAAEGGEF